MPGLRFGSDKDGNTRLDPFYCRLSNRLAVGCTREGGPTSCPLRRECPAGSLATREPVPAAPSR